jgi:hypothetical protein
VLPWAHVTGEITAEALVLVVGGLFLIWKGVKELRIKAATPESSPVGAPRPRPQG